MSFDKVEGQRRREASSDSKKFRGSGSGEGRDNQNEWEREERVDKFVRKRQSERVEFKIRKEDRKKSRKLKIFVKEGIQTS